MSKMKRSTKLAAYGAMGVGAVTFMSTAANADICFTDLTGSELVFTSTSPVGIDLDGDGTDDFNLELGTFGPNGYNSNSWLLNLRGAAAGNEVVANNFPGLLNLASGASISAQSFNSFGYFQQAYTSYNPGVTYGAWGAGTTGFAGIQFVDGGGTTRFGWIEMTVNGSVANGDFTDIEVSVSRFAFAKGEAITAGQTLTAVPEPTALGLLALGGIGVVARRRRKSQAE